MELLATQGDATAEEDFLSKSREEKRKKSLKRANKSKRKGSDKKMGKGDENRKKEILDDPFEMQGVEG